MTDQAFSKKQYQYILLILIIVIGLILFKEMRPYIGGFMGASTLYVLLRGQMKTLTEKKKMSRGVAATIILLEALFIFLIPLTGIGFMVADTISGIKIDPEAIKVSVYTFIDNIETALSIIFENLLHELTNKNDNILEIEFYKNNNCLFKYKKKIFYTKKLSFYIIFY